ncbi:MAG: chromosomal replication initiator protein DnaA [Chlamydiae bacterium CG10_big_fil_rev_8_21_14_0_10_35_9]|nr:MAG: chromosomal replication initiator protein DnaA [Chlamydiae bacterium CG10_big_fil_rev_8_21_14_0_10_35_9]
MTVSCDIKSVWTDFVQLVEKKCSATEFHNWIEPIKIKEETEDKLVLEVPNIFVQEYLIDNYKQDLLNFFSCTSIEELPFHFSIAAITPKEKKSSTSISKPQKTSHLQLNRNYTFENFIEGPSNQFVKSAAVGVANRPGKSYNPLFIHGGVGLGKTHLLHGIGHSVLQKNKHAKIQSITTEAFINDLVDNLKNKSVDKMKRFYRNLDILLVDDIQFLQNRLNFEDEFCNTFESLINQHKQIVITSDKPPSQLKLSDRMIARMEWGLVANIGVPDLETKVAIIQHKAETKGIIIPDDVAFYIADHVFLNVRQIEGAINRLFAYCRLMGEQITQDVVEKTLSEIFEQQTSKKVTVESILKSVASAFEVRISEIKGDSRMKQIALARQVAMYLSKELISDSLQKIANSFGGKTHSTLLHSWKKVSNQLSTNEQLQRQIQMIKKNLS